MEEQLNSIEIPDQEKEMIINVYRSWKSCYDNNIIIQNINYNHSANIKISKSIYINGIETYTNITSKSRIFFSNCSNISILVLNKINNIIIENCKNINLKTTSGIIGGIDVLHSSNINFVVSKKDVYHISFGDVYKSNTFIEKSLALNTLINTIRCNTINFILMFNEILEKIKYYTNNSLFEEYYLMIFHKPMDSNMVELRYINQNGQEGIIQAT